ncbi:hypothetical protein [Motilibacter deserti]|uniref:PAS domain-containing protein n=1 Tax=Motilibacter deserti TaxID=2714956 RepID=A0ABX0H2C9_9ACTN|nr:hypothetical protein [Motilibacter deserti]NHC15959.1 hypothetical protein [Motilibacter deserti]
MTDMIDATTALTDAPWTMDLLLPRWDQRERHDAWYAASPDRVWDALLGLRVADLRLTEALMRLRSDPVGLVRGTATPLGTDALVIDSVAPITLAADPGRELVLGDIAAYARPKPTRPEGLAGGLEAFSAFERPGYSKVVMDFRLVAERGGTRLHTETRVRTPDLRSRIAFSAYWVLVRVGSGLMRRDMLNAIGRTCG